MTAPKTIKTTLTKAFLSRCQTVRSFRHTCAEAFRRTGNEVYISNQWALPWYLNC
jgi:hypothetical protein